MRGGAQRGVSLAVASRNVAGWFGEAILKIAKVNDTDLIVVGFSAGPSSHPVHLSKVVTTSRTKWRARSNA